MPDGDGLGERGAKVGFDEYEGLADRVANDGLSDCRDLGARAANEGLPEGEGLGERDVKAGLDMCAGRDGRGANDGFSECLGRGDRGALENFVVLDDFTNFIDVGMRRGLTAAFGGRSCISGVGGLATLTPDAAVFNFATSNKVRLR